MNFEILRVAKLKTIGAVAGSGRHTFREQDTPNADPARTHLNVATGAKNTAELLDSLKSRLPEKRRKDAVLCLEYLISASPEWLSDRADNGKPYFDDALSWLREMHGTENVICANLQLDETSPHFVAYVVPLIDGKLNAKKFTGGSVKLSQMQTEFHNKVGAQHGLERGIEGSKARHKTIQKYYSEVNSAFQPLPEIKTPHPGQAPAEPEKPGFFAGSEKKSKWESDRASFELKKSQWELQRKQYMSELKSQKNVALKIVRQHEALAKSAEMLKRDVLDLKKSNSHYVGKSRQLETELFEAKQIIDLFTAEEIKRAQERRAALDLEKLQLAEITRLEAAESAKKTEIRKEFDNRVQAVQKLLQRGGAEHTFGLLAEKALNEAGGNASRIDWEAVERKTVIESIGRHGQSAESVTKAILAHSPLRADPASHEHLRSTVQHNAPQLEAKYQRERAQRQERDSGPRMR